MNADPTPTGDVEIDIRYFAMIREIVGQSSERRRLPDGLTIGELFDRLIEEHPRLVRLKPMVMPMANKSYVAADYRVRDGDEIAFIPPVSGGAVAHFRV